MLENEQGHDDLINDLGEVVIAAQSGHFPMWISQWKQLT